MNTKELETCSQHIRRFLNNMQSFFDKLLPWSIVYKRKNGTYSVKWKSNKYWASWISEDWETAEEALDLLLKTLSTWNHL